MKKGRSISKKAKIIIVLCCVAVLFAAIALVIHQTTRLTNESYANCSVGDINGDGFINSSDALLIFKSISEPDLLFDNQKRLADVNLDGNVNSSDVLILQRYTVGEIKSIPFSEDGTDDSGEKTDNRHNEYKTDKSLTNVQVMNKWDNGDGTHSYQFSVSVKNTGEEDIGGWSTVISLSGPAVLSKSWDCKCKVNADEIIVRNSTIATEETAVCGFIVTAPDGLAITSVKTTD